MLSMMDSLVEKNLYCVVVAAMAGLAFVVILPEAERILLFLVVVVRRERRRAPAAAEEKSVMVSRLV